MPKLTIDVEARLASFMDGMAQVQRTSEKTVEGVTKAFSRLGGLAATIGAGLSVGAIASSFKAIIDQAENFNKLAQKTGIATEALSAFDFAAQLSDVSTEDLGVGLKKLAVNMAAAAGGAKEQEEVFKSLGISLKDSVGQLKATDVVLREISVKFQSFKDGPEKAALAVALFGRSGDSMIPMLNNLKALTDEGEKFGAVFTGEFARASEQLNDDLKRLGITADKAKVAFLGESGVIAGLNEFVQAMIAANKISGSTAETLRLFAFNLDAMTSEAPRQEIERLTKALIDFQQASAIGRFIQSPTGAIFGGREEDLKKQIKFLQFLETQQIKVFEGARAPEEDLLGSGKLGKAPIVNQKAAKDRVAQISEFTKIVNQLTTELSKAEAEGNKFAEVVNRINAGDFGKLNEAEKTRLRNLAAQIQTQKELSDTQKQTAVDRANESEDEARRSEDAKKRLQGLKESIESAIDPSIVLRKRIEEIAEAVNSGLVDAEVGQAFKEKITNEFLEANKVFGELAANTENLNDVARDLGLTFSSAFEDAIVEGGSLSDVLKGIEKDLIRIAARKLVTEPLAGAFTGLLKGFFAGAGSAAFIEAIGGQGFASGTPFVPHDMPAFLHRGEAVIPAGGSRGGDININIDVDASGSTGDPAQSGRIMGAAISDAVRRELMTQQRSGGLLAA